MKKQTQSSRVETNASFNKIVGTASVALLGAGLAAQGSADYGPAVWRPVCSGKWNTSGYGKKFYVEHDMEGYYLSSIAYLQRCDVQASVHYAVNGKQDAASDAPAGEVSQLVSDVYYAWHACCWNGHSMGTEHEGFASNPAWYTDAMYSASAALTKSKAEKYGFAKDRNHIVGHGEKSNANWVNYANANLGISATCNTHTDPGPYWDWPKFMSMINSRKVKYDFTGDGKADLVCFHRGVSGDPAQGKVWVAPSTGGAFAAGQQWSSWFCIGGEIPAVGDFNGDGKADVATFLRGGGNAGAGVPDGNVFVALSTGTSFGGSALWHEFFCVGGEIPVVGDFNGDGRDDIATFLRGGGNPAAGVPDGNVFVSLSTGGSFGGSGLWHEFFCVGNEIPLAGDFNGDGKADIVTFVRGGGNSAPGVADGNVYVALSTGGSFGGSALWHEFFCVGSEIPMVGDVNGDGKDDIISFVRGGYNGAAGNPDGNVWVALSNGNGFGGGMLWSEFFCAGTELPGVADFGGDGKADVATFTRGTTGDVFVEFSSGSSFVPPAPLWNDWFGVGSEVVGPAPSPVLWP